MSEKLYGRIVTGTPIFQDHAFLRWPACKAPGGGYVAENPNMIFEVERKGTFWDCRAKGYGMMEGQGTYGNGSIFVSDEKGVQFVAPPKDHRDWSTVL